MKSKDEILVELKDRYGFSPTDTKWLPEGASIMEYIGIDLIVIEFNKTEKGDWTNTMKRGHIISLDEFDPISSTYLCKYVVEGMETGNWKEVRIIPEGFELVGPDSMTMTRFVPYSLHSKTIETEEFFKTLKVLNQTTKELDMSELLTISNSKNQDAILGYSHNIGALIELEDGEILWFRIKNIELRHHHKTVYNIVLTAWDNKRYVLGEIDSSEPTHKFTVEHSEVGRFKIIDLSRRG